MAQVLVGGTSLQEENQESALWRGCLHPEVDIGKSTLSPLKKKVKVTGQKPVPPSESKKSSFCKHKSWTLGRSICPSNVTGLPDLEEGPINSDGVSPLAQVKESLLAFWIQKVVTDNWICSVLSRVYKLEFRCFPLYALCTQGHCQKHKKALCFCLFVSFQERLLYQRLSLLSRKRRGLTASTPTCVQFLSQTETSSKIWISRVSASSRRYKKFRIEPIQSAIASHYQGNSWHQWISRMPTYTFWFSSLIHSFWDSHRIATSSFHCHSSCPQLPECLPRCWLQLIHVGNFFIAFWQICYLWLYKCTITYLLLFKSLRDKGREILPLLPCSNYICHKL